MKKVRILVWALKIFRERLNDCFQIFWSGFGFLRIRTTYMSLSTQYWTFEFQPEIAEFLASHEERFSTQSIWDSVYEEKAVSFMSGNVQQKDVRAFRSRCRAALPIPPKISTLASE
jgi:hypothetical protein